MATWLLHLLIFLCGMLVQFIFINIFVIIAGNRLQMDGIDRPIRY